MNKTFKPNKKFIKEYRALYGTDPEAANLMLLLCELANDKGELISTEDELIILFNIRFNDPKENLFPRTKNG